MVRKLGLLNPNILSQADTNSFPLLFFLAIGNRARFDPIFSTGATFLHFVPKSGKRVPALESCLP